jgi:hypothetical protein
MKKILLIAVAAFVSVSVYAQGTVNFSNIGRQVLQAPEKGGGVVPAGAGFMAALYWAAAGVTDESAFMQIGAAATFLAPGTIVAGTRTAPVTPPGASANFQVRVWEVADPNHVGKSAILTVDSGDPTTVPPGTPGSLTGTAPGQGNLQNIQMEIVPEPSVIALGALGAGALLLLRRRK